MAHCFVESTAGETEGNNNGLKQQHMSQWLTQHGLNANVVTVLHQNDVDSLDDLKLLESEQDINEFVSSLGIKGFIVKKKLTNAIKSFQDEIKSKHDHCDNDEKEAPKDLKRKAIRWEALGNKLEKKDTIKIQKNKSEEIKIRKTAQEHKQRLSEWRQEYGEIENGYFGGLGQHIKDTYEHDGVITAGLASVLYTALTIIPILPLAYATIKSNQHKEDQNLTHKKHCNAQSKTFNDKLTQIKQSEQWILSKQKELKQQEQRLNSHSFEVERICDIRNKSRVVMVIGPTGFGKSLIANRLLGNEHDIDDIMESTESDFSVALSGNIQAVTDKLNKKSKIVHITVEENKDDSFVLSVVDTPGAFDTNDNDNDYNNMMTHYFAACGGINVFAIFFKFNGKMTNKYKELLKQYAAFFGDGLWKHCAIFITYCDMDSDKATGRVTKGLHRTKDQIHSDLQEISNGQCDDVSIYTFGEDNFKKSTFDFLASLMDESSAFYDKYKCKNIQSPIDVLYGELKQKVKQHKKLTKELHDMLVKAKEAKDKVDVDDWTTEANKLQKDAKLRHKKLNELQNNRANTHFTSDKAQYMRSHDNLQEDANEYNKWENE
eukprot:300312_1